MNFHTKAFIPLLLGLASLATVHGSLPSTTPTAETLHSRTPFDACHLSITRTDPFTNSSIIGLTPFLNVWGYLSATYRYDPYGRTIAQAGPMAQTNRYRFSSKEYHEPSGLYYYGYRFYSTELQRWLNRDPIAENGGINLYGFAGNQPSGRIDLYGHRVKGAFELIGGFIKKYIFNAKKPNANVGHRPSSPDNISKYTVWLEYIILWECRSKSNGEDECMILCMSFGYESTPYFNCWNLCINSYKARCAKLKNGQKTNRKSPILFIFPQ